MPRFKALGGRHELGSLTDDFTLNRAFQLAHSIYQYREADRGVALDILRESLRAIEVRLVAQDEADRHAPHKPTKVRWGAAQWLQLLIYSYSERHEKQQETRGRDSLGEEDMLIRYLKHLILITCRRNSFHISLGLARLLYDYSAAETIAIYDFVYQDPDSSTRKADAYYRARKNMLVDELHSRFRQFMHIVQGPRGERRFQTHERPAHLKELTARYLRLFTTWDTSCDLPERFNAWSAVGALQAGQLSQIHALIHPDCFSRIARALNLDPPEQRLALPTIFLTRDGGAATDSGDGPAPSALSPEEAAALRDGLAEDKEQRRRFSPRTLTVLADGVERARMDLQPSGSVSFEVGEETNLLELVGIDGTGGELLLATHLLTWETEEADLQRVYTTVLEGGQKISLAARVVRNSAGDVTGASVNVAYGEPNAAGSIALLWRRLINPSAGFARAKPLGLKPVPRSVLAVTLALAVIAGIVIFYVLRGNGDESRQIVRLEQPHPDQERAGEEAGTERTAPPADAAPTPQPRTSGKGPERQSRPPSTGGPVRSTRPGGATREQQGSPTAASLAGVKRVYVESPGNDALGAAVRQKLIDALRAEGVFEVAEAPDDADAAVTWELRRRQKGGDSSPRRQPESVSYIVEVVNVTGEVIWRGGAYRGTAEQIASRLTRELVGAVRGARRRD